MYVTSRLGYAWRITFLSLAVATAGCDKHTSEAVVSVTPTTALVGVASAALPTQVIQLSPVGATFTKSGTAILDLTRHPADGRHVARCSTTERCIALCRNGRRG